jgi:hypothetical protein
MVRRASGCCSKYLDRYFCSLSRLPERAGVRVAKAVYCLPPHPRPLPRRGRGIESPTGVSSTPVTPVGLIGIGCGNGFPSPVHPLSTSETIMIVPAWARALPGSASAKVTPRGDVYPDGPGYPLAEYGVPLESAGCWRASPAWPLGRYQGTYMLCRRAEDGLPLA